MPVLVAACALTGACSISRPPDCAAANDPRLSDECLRRNAGKSDVDRLLACIPFSPAVPMKGVWITSLENSSFFEGARSVDPAWFRQVSTWLEVDPLPAEALRSMQGEAARAYRVEFIGRRSLCRGPYMGVYPHEVVVGRFTSVAPLPVR